MNRIFLKSTAVAFSSLLASLILAITLVPTLGGVVDGNAWLMLTICPLAIAWPASAFTFWQGERLKSAHRELARAHAQLAAAHRRLEEKASILPSGDQVGDSENSGSWVSRATLVRCSGFPSVRPLIRIALHVTSAPKSAAASNRAGNGHRRPVMAATDPGGAAFNG